MRTPYVFNNYSWPVNPSDDSGWIQELVLSEQVPINASRSVIQVGAFKSATRQMSGYIWGVNAQEQYNTMLSWFQNKTQANLIDYLGITRKAILTKFEPKIVNDITAYKAGRFTFQYTAVFTALD